MTRIDPELGPVKTCNVCLEEWPLDEEFWYFTVMPVGQVVRSRGRTYTRKTTVRHVYSRCRACWSERSRADYWRRKSGDKGVLVASSALDSGGVEPTAYRGPR